jgi:hypothetical protein
MTRTDTACPVCGERTLPSPSPCSGQETAADDRRGLNRNVAAPSAEAMLDHGGARSGARAELDNHRLTAFGYRHSTVAIAAELGITAAIARRTSPI